MPIKNEIYAPNEFEKNLMKKHPKESDSAIELAYLSQSVMTFLFLSPYQQHNNGDAFRHCFWSALIAKDVSPEWALTWTTAHEEGRSSNNIYRRMDEFNNSEGLNLIRNNSLSETFDLIHLCLDLIKNGKLKVKKGDELVPSSLDGFNLPSIFSVISESFDELLDFIIKYYRQIVQEKDGDNNTALHRCIMKDYLYGFNSIINNQVIDVNSPGFSGMSPLMLCSIGENRKEFANILLKNGADADYQDPFNGETALMLAAAYNDRGMVELLLPKSNKKLKSFNGSTAYDMAITEEHLQLAALLK